MRKNKIINFLVVVIILILAFWGGYSYGQLEKTKNNIKDSENSSMLIDRVSSLYLVPKGEVPTIATVSDPQAVKEKSFFTLSEKGDKVLIFTSIGKAILYRPSIDKIVEVISVKNN